MPEHTFVVDAAIVEYFGHCSKLEREELLRIFHALAKSPYQKREWIQRTKSGREIQVKRVGPWLISFWLDEPVLEVRIVDVKRVGS